MRLLRNDKHGAIYAYNYTQDADKTQSTGVVYSRRCVDLYRRMVANCFADNVISYSQNFRCHNAGFFGPRTTSPLIIGRRYSVFTSLPLDGRRIAFNVSLCLFVSACLSVCRSKFHLFSVHLTCGRGSFLH